MNTVVYLQILTRNNVFPSVISDRIGKRLCVRLAETAVWVQTRARGGKLPAPTGYAASLFLARRTQVFTVASGALSAFEMLA